MTEVMRIMAYGAQHPIIVIGDETGTELYVVVGPCCESGDILTPVPGHPEEIQPRLLKKAKTKDIVVMEGVGGYCSAMAPRGYNSYT